MSGSNEVARIVLRYVTEHPGQSLHYRDLSEDLKLDHAAVNAALNRAVTKHPEYGIQRVGAGRFMYRQDWSAAHLEEAPPKSTDSIYEKVGTIGGRVILRDENNELWQLMAVKLAD